MIFKPAAYFGRPVPAGGFRKVFGLGVATAPVLASVTIIGPGIAGQQHRVVVTYTGQPYPPPQLDIDWKNGGSPIAGADGSTYIPPSTFSMTVTVTASNSEGSSDPMTSDAVALKPGYVAAPVLGGYTGTPRIGDTLTCPDVTVIGQTSSIVKRWFRDDVEISAGGSYPLTGADDLTKVYCQIDLTGANGTTSVRSNSVFPVYAPPVVTINDITDNGFTNITEFDCDFEVSGHAESVVVTWLDYTGDPVPIQQGNPVIFANPVPALRATVMASNSGGQHTALSAETAVVEQATAPGFASATIDRGGETVAPGTPLNAIITGITGAPTPQLESIQWTDNGVPISGATSALLSGWSGLTGPIAYDFVLANGVAPNASGSSSDSVAVATSLAPELSGIPDFNLETTDPVVTYDLKQHAFKVTGAAWAADLEEMVAEISIPFETGDWAFIAYKHLFAGADRWIATGTGQSTNPFTGTPVPLPTGFANSEQPGVVRAENGVADGSYSMKLWGGDGTSAVSVLATLVGAAPGAITAPPAPPDANWQLEDNGDGRLRIVVVSPFPNGGSPNTDRQYEVDDSGTWVSFGVTGNGTFFIPAESLTLNQQASVKLRAINAIGTGAESNAKTATPTAPGALQATAADDFVTWSGTSGLASADVSDDFVTWSAA